jgi:hypothetical protein
VISQAQVDDTIRPLLDAAEAEGKLVLVSSHHASSSLTDNGGLGGMTVPGAYTPEDWHALLGEYDNVVAHLCGHSHVHRVEWIEPMAGLGTGYWEVTTSALIDWPHQMRVMEIHDQDNGWLTLHAVSVDYATDDDPLAEEGRTLAIADFTGGWSDDGTGELDDRNVTLWLPLP